jgi:hypothetical protein
VHDTNDIGNNKRFHMKKSLMKCALAVAALCSVGAAQAALITFDGLAESPNAPFMPLLGHGDEFYQAGMWIDPWSTKAGRQLGDLVGAIVDGSDLANTCFGVICPSNNTTSFYTALNDSQLYLGNLSGKTFRMDKFDASFVAASGDAVPSTALILRVDGYLGSTLVGQQDFYLPGPVGGAYSFMNYQFNAAFAGTAIDQVVFYGYSCNAAGACGRASDKAQFALDNIQTVPEPASFLLLGLAGAAAAYARRRRAV